MLASPTHVLHKLRWEISQLKKALVSEPEKLAYTHAPAYFAFNCAVTAWHLADWVWEASGSDQRAEILQRFRCGAAQASKSSFQKALMERFRAYLPSDRYRIKTYDGDAAPRPELPMVHAATEDDLPSVLAIYNEVVANSTAVYAGAFDA